MIDKNHFRWHDLRPMLVERGWHRSITEIEKMRKDIEGMAAARSKRLQELLESIKTDYDPASQKVKFRPCHQRRLAELKVTTECWVV